MSPTEYALKIECQGEVLIGIVSDDAHACATTDLGLLIIVGGPQYRVGSHRQFVQLARKVAMSGVPVLRFDVRGMGDSTGDLHTFQQISEDIAAAVTAFQEARPSLRRVALWGLCDAASAALLYVHERSDPRVAGIALLNPWIRSTSSEARTRIRHYYFERLVQGTFWRKLFSGKVAWSALNHFLHSLHATFRSPKRLSTAILSFQDKMANGWANFRGPVLLLLSENDFTGREFQNFTASSENWQKAIQAHPAETKIVLGADHTCSAPGSKAVVEQATIDWLTALRTAKSP
ncbi:hydrolase 1, exosortase A system-associated [Rubrivivax sp. RP6-9]|uniref:hydrolase 1, exosortase A system-associated n=1 Tax=Rubrivivax sp. RP6-9 TaxID=3415750 RepID=UPI003CC5FBF6